MNADEVAGGIASLLKVKKLIFFTDVEGVLDEHKKTIRTIKISNIKKLIANSRHSGSAEKIISGGMIPKILNCARAIKNGVGEVDILSINLKGTKILEG